MLAYLWVQRYKGTEILKQNHFGIQTYKKQKTETTVWIPWAEASVCVFTLQCYLRAQEAGFELFINCKTSCSICKMYEMVPKKAANFWGWNSVFCKQRFCNHSMSALQMFSKGSLRDFCNNELAHSWCGFVSHTQPHSLLIPWALNGLAEQPPGEPRYSNEIENKRHDKLILPQIPWCSHKMHGSRQPPFITE